MGPRKAWCDHCGAWMAFDHYCSRRVASFQSSTQPIEEEEEQLVQEEKTVSQYTPVVDEDEDQDEETKVAKPNRVRRVAKKAIHRTQAATWRASAKQLVTRSKKPVTALLKKKLGKAIDPKLLDHPLSDAVLSILMGILIEAAPIGGKKKRRLAYELQVNGLTDFVGAGQNLFLDPVMKPLLKFIEGLPDA